MCVILYKPNNVRMPDKAVLKTCYDNNPDGAGYMYSKDNNVFIKKGFMTFNEFYKSLKATKKLWNNTPFVIHFRISTQAGVNKECTHPFPLSSNMNDLKKLSYKSNIGIAHNGIIDLTSNYYKKDIKHSDTMEFITDYLSLIIDNINYYKNNKTLELIERLCGSKLAILDRCGHCELIGNFENVDGCYFSNSSYKVKVAAPTRTVVKSNNKYAYDSYDEFWYDAYGKKSTTKSDDELEAWDYAEYFFNTKTGLYEFDVDNCTDTVYGVDDYCMYCARYNECYCAY